METSNSDATHAALQAQNGRWYLGPIGICYSGPKVAVLNAKTTDEGWDTLGLVIQVLIKLFSMHKTTGYVWDSQRLVIPVQKSLLCIQNPHMSAGTDRD